ncbi:MAG: helix-turn-helix transcriptional regulator [Planctomycetes bacterium]|nr:helix-turn-helix transcriptional regulator [Planctomycetota bacterium]
MGFAIPAHDAVEGRWSGLFIARGRRLAHPRRRMPDHELILVRSGRLGIAEDGVDLSAGPGQAVLLVAGREHWGTVDYPSDLSFYWLHFRSRADKTLADVPQRLVPRRPDLLMAMLHRYIDDQTAGMHTPATAGLAVHLMLAELCAAPPAAAADPAAPLVGRAEAWIGHHYQDGISTRDVAEALGCNPDYLGRVFRRCTGRTLVDAIVERRLGEVRRRLIDTAADIAAIAREAGFHDLTNFRRAFRERCGCTPGEFRAQHARAHVNSD